MAQAEEAAASPAEALTGLQRLEELLGELRAMARGEDAVGPGVLLERIADRRPATWTS